MMQQTNMFDYSEDNFCQYIKLPYTDKNYYMFIALPKKNIGYNMIQENLSDLFNKKFDNVKVCLTIPKFEHRNRTDLRDLFEQIGLRDLFTSNANFTKIFDTPTKVDKIIHEAVVNISEEGTEASAATAALCSYGLSTNKQEKIYVFDANHPFYYAIMYNSTILFNGIFTGK